MAERGVLPFCLLYNIFLDKVKKKSTESEEKHAENPTQVRSIVTYEEPFPVYRSWFGLTSEHGSAAGTLAGTLFLSGGHLVTVNDCGYNSRMHGLVPY